jgi:hypothetical protein
MSTPQAVVTKSGKLRRTDSPTPSSAGSTRADTVISNPQSAFNPMYGALGRYLGGNWMAFDKYRKIFGDVSPASPFGEHIWDGLITYFDTGYVNGWGTKYTWCGDRRQYQPWLGAYNMPMHFSKAVSRSPIVDDQGLPSSALYPAVFLLTLEQDAYVKSIAGHHQSIVFGNGRVDKHQADEDTSESEMDLESTTACHIADSQVMGEIYMICLKILVSGSKPWTVSMDHIHLYTPFPPSKL